VDERVMLDLKSVYEPQGQWLVSFGMVVAHHSTTLFGVETRDGKKSSVVLCSSALAKSNSLIPDIIIVMTTFSFHRLLLGGSR